MVKREGGNDSHILVLNKMRQPDLLGLGIELARFTPNEGVSAGELAVRYRRFNSGYMVHLGLRKCKIGGTAKEELAHLKCDARLRWIP